MSYITSRKHAAAPRHRSSVALAAAFALPGAAFAQAAAAPAAPASQAEATLPTVKVHAARESDYKAETTSSTKFTEPLLDTPQTITVIKKELFLQQGATTLTEALRNTPGVGAFYLGENGSTSRGDAIYMRGVDSSGSIFVDGIRDVAPVSRDVFNIDAVEVEKGPAGTDNGHSTPGGSVNLVSKHAELGNATSASTTAGQWNQNRATLDVNRQFSDDAAWRVTVLGQESGTPGRDRVKNNRWGVAPTVSLGLGTPTTVKLNYLHVTQNNVPDGGLPTVGLPGYSGPATADASLASAGKVNTRNFYGGATDYENNSTDQLTAAVEHTFDNKFVLRNTTRVGETVEDYSLTSFTSVTAPSSDTSTWTLARLANNLHQINVIETNQTSLTGQFATGAIKHSFNTGFELIGEAQRTKGLTATGVNTTVNLYAPDSDLVSYTRAYNGTRTEGKTGTVAAYAFDTLHIGEQFIVTGGVRLDHYRTHYNAIVACGGTSSTAVACPTGAATGSPVQGTNLEATGNLFGWKLGGVFKPTADGSLYANYAVSAQPPGGTNFSLSATSTTNGGTSNMADADPEKARTAEVGVKWNFLAGQLGVTGDLYRTEILNDIESDGGTPAQYLQTGKKRVQGVELAVVGNLTPDWAVNAGFTTQNTAILSGHSEASDTSSLALNYTPRIAFTSWTTYKLPYGLTVGGGANYSDKLQRQSDSAVGTPKYVNGYWVANGMLDYAVNKSLDLRLNVYNLANKSYVASINKSGYRYTPGAPRYATITANLQF